MSDGTRRDRLVRMLRRVASDRNRVGAIFMIAALVVVGGMLITGAVLRTQQPAPQAHRTGPETIGPGSPNYGEHTGGTARSHQPSYSTSTFLGLEAPLAIRL